MLNVLWKEKHYSLFESTATSFADLKEALLEEYGQKKNSAFIHERLKAHKKNAEDTPILFLYQMLSIVSETDTDVQNNYSHYEWTSWTVIFKSIFLYMKQRH